ncbi:hypothetical protein Syun_014925 [Stephania yunnanensis]|uniref:Uncharacterized protein n=1 Tax=Stephania yunnanensis TaxID=152371 RepID=A0AAP0PCB1_9MAGN
MTRESVMQYMDQYLCLMEYAGSATDTDADQAYYFVHGLLDSIGSVEARPTLSTLQEAYERAMTSKSFGSTRTGVSVASSASSQSVGGSGGDRRRKIFRLLRQRDQAQRVDLDLGVGCRVRKSRRASDVSRPREKNGRRREIKERKETTERKLVDGGLSGGRAAAIRAQGTRLADARSGDSAGTDRTVAVPGREIAEREKWGDKLTTKDPVDLDSGN